MVTQFTWKTKAFSRRFEIYQYTSKVGELRKVSLSRKTDGEMNGEKFVFKNKGFIKQETLITNPDNDSVLGTISFKTFKSKATILYNDKEYIWQFDNFFRTKWSVSNENGPLIKYHSRNFNGTIDSFTSDELLVLTGFFIRNYKKQKSSEAAAAS